MVTSESALTALGLSKQVGDTAEMARAVEHRIALGRVQEMMRAGFLTQDELFQVVVPRRTYAHRKQRKEPLTVEESDRVVRIARLADQAIAVFGNAGKAMGWLRRASERFSGKSPMTLAETEHGGRVIEEALVQIAEGMHT